MPCLLAGCGGTQNALNPHSHPAADIANLFWVMMAVSFGGLALITGLLVFAWVRRGRRGFGGADPADPHPGEKPAWFVVLGGGVVFPLMVVTALFIVGNWAILNVTQAPAASSTAMTVDAIGHQWYWEFRYPGTRAVTADEMHIPVGTRVNLVATTADVIHSFWVPELNRKIDTIPGQQNRILLYANKRRRLPGRVRRVLRAAARAHGDARLRPVEGAVPAWLRRQSAPAATPTTALARRGQQIFLTGACSSCHAIRGTTARGYVGPDLTHLASRTTLAGADDPEHARATSRAGSSTPSTSSRGTRCRTST